MSDRSAAVIGGGIGGLAAAVALRQAGWAVTVFEQKSTVSEVDAALSLMPNALRALDKMSLLGQVREFSLTSTVDSVRSTTGRTLVGPTTGSRLRGPHRLRSFLATRC